MQYDDGFTLQRVSDEHIENFFYVAGMVPFLQKLIADVSRFDGIGEFLMYLQGYIDVNM